MKRNNSSKRIRLADTIGETWGWGVFKGKPNAPLRFPLPKIYFWLTVCSEAKKYINIF
jgi:hypothetical protein